ncbi:hypothetical protein BOTBODRAFT_471816 [Botryobasidium botryosum FD-172 SS1]|uniref:Uncharacterized protein n=1 Tax=Botryobasidium botryosum (strain FD-172 SS1) TaxID=930990 RepID=A0A067MH70_BOTB1|nr:hypothetical protein BOTBODRAFT_471816 [Botryobasidium botryosum FD-172 SS1]
MRLLRLVIGRSANRLQAASLPVTVSLPQSALGASSHHLAFCTTKRGCATHFKVSRRRCARSPGYGAYLNDTGASWSLRQPQARCRRSTQCV